MGNSVVWAASPGQSKWALSFDEGAIASFANDQFFTSLAVDRNDNIFVAAKFYNTVNVGGGTVLNPTSSSAAFLAKFDSSGRLIWVKNLASGYLQQITKLAVDQNGNVVVCGFFQTRIDCG